MTAEPLVVTWHDARTLRTAALGFALCGLLVAAGLRWPTQLAESTTDHAHLKPFAELCKLIVAALVGCLVSAIHRPRSSERPAAMAQAQTLLCVAGAMTMILVGNSLARAFGIAGAASIIRFRTPVDDPKDVTILFLLMGLGMAAGLGAFAVVGLGTAFLSTVLLALGDTPARKPRVMSLEVTAMSDCFPTTHVEDVFARHHIVFEPREIARAECALIKYVTWINPQTPIADISAQLMNDGAGVKSVAWEQAKRERS